MTPDKEHTPALMQQAGDEAGEAELRMVHRGGPYSPPNMGVLLRAADTIATLTAQLAAAEKRVALAAEALKPFAGQADVYEPDDGDDGHTAWASDFSMGQLRRARAALRTLTQEPSNAE